MAASKADERKQLLLRGVEDVVERKHLERALRSGKKLRVKHGIDPTGPKIHLGRAATLRKVRAFQEAGHKIILIVGDFTAQVGDPSDKLSKRPMLTAGQVQRNLKNYKKQLGKIIDLSKAEFHFNSKWLKKLDFREISELAESFSVQQMLARRNFKERFLKSEEISLREFLYPLMQGYDSVAVRADLEIGGTDQLFNLMAGRVVQRHYGQKEQDILTTQMIEGTDGRKMSTSWGNVITIVDKPNDMFGEIMSIKDDLIVKYFVLATDVPAKEVIKIEKSLKGKKTNPRDIKARLAYEIVELYHGEEKAGEAEAEFNRVFQKKKLPTRIPVRTVPGDNHTASSLIYVTGAASSMSAARRLVEQDAVKLDYARVKDPKEKIKIPPKGVLLQVGKRKFFRVKKS